MNNRSDVPRRDIWSRPPPPPPPAPCSIPPEMLSSRCVVRISFRFPPVSDEQSIFCEEPSILDHRHTRWHKGMHCEHESQERHECCLKMMKGHECSLKVSTSLFCDLFTVHRLTRCSPEGQWVEISAHCPHGDDPSGCNCIDDDDSLLHGGLRAIQIRLRIKHSYERHYKMLREDARKFALLNHRSIAHLPLQLRLNNNPAPPTPRRPFFGYI